MDKVFVVTSGCYSDFGIDAIFSTKEQAEDYIDRMNFVSAYDEGYRIQIWDVDKIPTEIPTNDFCLFNNEVVRLDDLCFKYSEEGYITSCIFEDLREKAKFRVLEITKEDYEQGILYYDWHEEKADINKIQFPIYCVLKVKYDKDKSIIEKVVYDEIAKYKAEKEGL